MKVIYSFLLMAFIFILIVLNITESYGSVLNIILLIAFSMIIFKSHKRDKTLKSDTADLDAISEADLEYVPLFIAVCLITMIGASQLGSKLNIKELSHLDYYSIIAKLVSFMITISLYYIAGIVNRYKKQQAKLSQYAFEKNIENKIQILKSRTDILEKTKSFSKEDLVIEYLNLIDEFEIPIMMMYDGMSVGIGIRSKELEYMTSKIDELQREYDNVFERVNELNNELNEVVMDGSKEKQRKFKSRKAISRKQGNNSFKRHSR